jgi:16S rRNA processing protein RimM
VKGESLAIGRLGAPKGVRGDLKVHSYSGESAHIHRLKEASLRGSDPATGAPRTLKLKVARVEGSGASLTIAFEGYPSPEAARALTGMDIVAPRSEAAPLKANEWYVVDLVGLALVVGGEKVATVRSILEGGADPWLEAVVSTPDSGGASGAAKRGAERVSLVPFRKEFVGEVDIEAGTIELLAPELLDE